MSQDRVRPIGRSGAWELEGGFQGPAVRALVLAEAAARDLREEWMNVERQHGRRLAATRIPREKLVDRNLYASATVVLSAMAVESFLNWYGVVRLGEDFYGRHYERLGLVQKLSAIVATCTGILLDEKAEIVVLASRLSERRNRLVHPKTREVPRRDRSPVSSRTAMDRAKESVADMTAFFDLFVRLDPKASGMADHA